LLSKLRNVHPVVVHHILDELLLPFVLPEQRRVGPLILRTVFSDFIAHLVEVVDNLGRILLDIDVIADLIVKNSLLKLNFLLFHVFPIGVLFLFHSGQQLFPLLLVDFVHLVLDLAEATDYIVD
jgi:hypothetical protein